MKLYTILCFAVLSFTLINTVYCQDSGFGFGIIIGEPTGLGFKNWLSSNSAFDIGIAWSFVKNQTFHIHADYLLHSFEAIESTEQIPIYYGVGGRIKTHKNETTRIGIRGAVGIGYFIRNTPIDIFLEIAPIMDLIPGTELNFNAGLGVRFFP